MRIKLFVLPVAIIASIVIFISYTWPQVKAMDINQQAYSDAETVLEKAKARQQNINGLVSQLDSSAANEEMVADYYPEAADMDDVIHALEQVIGASNVSLLNISTMDPGELTGTIDQSVVDPATGLPVGTNALSKKYVGVSLSVLGEYDRLIDLLKKVDNFKRRSDVASYSIQSQALEGGETALTMTVDVRFLSASKVSLDDQQAARVFEQSQFDMAIVDKFKQQMQENVTDLNAGTVSGKANPFAS